MTRLDDVLVPRTLLAVQEVNVSHTLAMIYSDGVEFREKVSLEVLPRDGKDRISSLGQTGFGFPSGGPCELPFESPPASQLCVTQIQEPILTACRPACCLVA